MRKKMTASIVSLVLASMLLVLVGSMGEAKKPTLLICDIWPPYQINSPNGVTGFSVDLVSAVYKRMDIPIESIEAFPWKRALEIIQHGHAEALFSANFTPDRMAFARYPSEMLTESPWVIWTRGRGQIKTLDDLKGKTIGVVLGYSYTPEFWDFIETYCTVEKVRSDEINFKKLSAGRLDATIAEYGNGHYLSTTLGLDNLKPNHALTIKKDGLYIIFSRKSVTQDFVEEFSKELKAFKETGEHKVLREKCFGI